MQISFISEKTKVEDPEILTLGGYSANHPKGNFSFDFEESDFHVTYDKNFHEVEFHSGDYDFSFIEHQFDETCITDFEKKVQKIARDRDSEAMDALILESEITEICYEFYATHEDLNLKKNLKLTCLGMSIGGIELNIADGSEYAV